MVERKKPGQGEIARRLGVSVSTVSRALAGSEAVSPDVRARVLRTAERLGYAQRRPRVLPGLRRIWTVATLAAFRDLRSSIYLLALEALRSEAAAVGAAFETAMTRPGEGLPEAVAAAIGPDEGVVFLGVRPDEAARAVLAARAAPAVLCNDIDDACRLDAVAPANFSGGMIAAGRLLQDGHRRVGVLLGPDRPTLRRRMLGLRLRLEEAGGGVVGAFPLGAEPEGAAAAAFGRWLDGLAERPTALFCYNDSAAAWAIEALRERGLATPDDMSVMGFDDMPIASLTDPGLTTLRVDWADLGRCAVRMIGERAADPQGPARFLQIGASLIERGSICCASR